MFLNQSAEFGGGELFLRDLMQRTELGSLVCFQSGPLTQWAVEQGIQTTIARTARGTLGLTRSDTAPTASALLSLIRVIIEVAVRAKKASLLYANSQKAFVVAAISGYLARRPVIWHLHDILIRDHFSAQNIKLVVWLANHFAARVIANSHASADAFIKNGGSPSKVRVIYNGIDADLYGVTEPSLIADLRRNIGVPDVRTVGSFSRLAPWKGQHVLLNAVARLPGVHALIVGGALFDEKDYALALRLQAKALGIDGRVHFLGFREDVSALMQLVDVVVHTSVTSEPFGRVIVEGMLSGRPVIATRGGGTQEIISDGDTGFLTTPGDAAELAEKIQQLFDLPAVASGIASTGRLSARAEFCMNRMLAQISQQIAEVRCK